MKMNAFKCVPYTCSYRCNLFLPKGKSEWKSRAENGKKIMKHGKVTVVIEGAGLQLVFCFVLFH